MAFGEKSAIDLYLEEISKIPLMTREEELLLANQIASLSDEKCLLDEELKNSSQNDIVKHELEKKIVKTTASLDRAKHKMIRGNCRLVVNIAKRYRNSFLSLADLIEEGNLGLLKAVDRFDPRRGFRFSTFAIWWIKQSIIKSIKDKGSTIRIPIHIDKDISKFKKVISDFTSKNYREPSLQELIKITRFTKKKIGFLLNVPGDFVSIDKKIGDSSKDLSEILEDTEKRYSPVETLLNESLRQSLDTVLSNLSEKEHEIIKLRFGLGEQSPMILEQIGETLGITRERVRQIQAVALKKMRTLAKESELDIFRQ